MTFIQYLRKGKHRRPVGMVIVNVDEVSPVDGTVELSVGWSLCRKEDRWDRNIGYAIAYGRRTCPKNQVRAKFHQTSDGRYTDDAYTVGAVSVSQILQNMPQSLHETFLGVSYRAIRFCYNELNCGVLFDSMKEDITDEINGDIIRKIEEQAASSRFISEAIWAPEPIKEVIFKREHVD